MPATLGEKRKHSGGRFLDGAARDIDRRPIVPGTEPPRGGDFLGHRLLIDIFVVVAMRAQAEQAVLSDLHDSLGRGAEPDDQRIFQRSTLAGKGTPRTSGMFAVFTPRLAR